MYVSYDTNSVQDTVETKVHLPNQNCTILNNDDAYTKTTDKNGIFFFEVQCPSIDTEKTIQILADVSWLEDDSTILVPNVRTLAKDGIWYEDNGKAFVAKDKFGIGMTNTQRTNNWKSAVYGRSLEQTHNNLGRGDAIKNNGKIVLQNTNLELPTGQSIIEKATTLVSADEKANIEIPENTAIISQLGM